MLALSLVKGPLAYADIRGLPQITVLADSSLTIPLTEIIRLYSRDHDITVTASYGSTSEQARSIQEGESADVFIAAHPAWMSDLKQKGLIDVYSLTNLVKDRLALVISASNHLNGHPVLKQNVISQLAFLNDRMIMVMADPEDTALGLYTKQAVKNLGKLEDIDLWGDIKGKIVRSANAKNSLYLIAQGNSAGIIYHSDAYLNKEVNVLSVIDESLYDPMIYQAAVVAGESMPDARDFLEFLKSGQVKAIFQRHGFVVD